MTDKRDSPVTEIEITPEMIAWGAGELCSRSLRDLAEGDSSVEEAVTEVYRVMRRVALGLPAQPDEQR